MSKEQEQEQEQEISTIMCNNINIINAQLVKVQNIVSKNERSNAYYELLYNYDKMILQTYKNAPYLIQKRNWGDVYVLHLRITELQKTL